MITRSRTDGTESERARDIRTEKEDTQTDIDDIREFRGRVDTRGTGYVVITNIRIHIN